MVLMWRNMKPGNMSMKQKLPWRSQADYMPQEEEEEEEVLRQASVEKHETRKYEYEAEIALERSQADYMPQEEEEEFLRQASPKKKMNIFLRMKTASSEWSMFLFSFFFLALFSLIMFIV
ncbi:uncharacterized protein ACNLHF_023424 isoform 4-T4 [Anomaloglossus baeobatrachus]